MASKLYCSDCPQLDKRDRNSYGEFYCNQKRKYVKHTDSACGYLDADKARQEYHRSGFSWYIVSAIAKRLNTPEVDEILATTLRLKNEYLPLNEEGKSFLSEYDAFGPALALQIFEEPVEFAQGLVDRFLAPCTQEINNNNFDEAFNIYKNMFYELKEEYDLNLVSDYANEKYLGQARTRIKPNM